MGMGVLGVRLSQTAAESSRPWAPEQPESAHDLRAAHRRARRAERLLARAHEPASVPAPRRVVARELHRLADALAPAERHGADRLGHPAR